MSERSDDISALMQAGTSGDSKAYAKALHRLAQVARQAVRNTFARYGRGPADVEDVVQETMLAVHLKRHTWDVRKPLEPWVRAIAHHKLVDFLRRRGFREHVDIDDYADSLSTDDGQRAAHAHDCSHLLAGLTARQRKIVEGMSIEGRSAREVAAALDMTEGAVRVALHRALKDMAAAYHQGDA